MCIMPATAAVKPLRDSVLHKLPRLTFTLILVILTFDNDINTFCFVSCYSLF